MRRRRRATGRFVVDDLLCPPRGTATTYLWRPLGSEVLPFPPLGLRDRDMRGGAIRMPWLHPARPVFGLEPGEVPTVGRVVAPTPASLSTGNAWTSQTPHCHEASTLLKKVQVDKGIIGSRRIDRLQIRCGYLGRCCLGTPSKFADTLLPKQIFKIARQSKFRSFPFKGLGRRICTRGTQMPGRCVWPPR